MALIMSPHRDSVVFPQRFLTVKPPESPPIVGAPTAARRSSHDEIVPAPTGAGDPAPRSPGRAHLIRIASVRSPAAGESPVGPWLPSPYVGLEISVD
ncbi:hypothetical protein GCM10010116_22410 [Microbispora rosea subsp. aerata]|nr:hypothetical protein GCM10010116_22410 [Microbispora rosea subsp. aerata]GIH53576.1 hypothetical protein Mro02_04900 [Microbispora rosea subsp. aerata]GLJ86293.1 hypothetical protein GCM10017588_50280 [Microbispora rosea subsp. aerata]